jgi:hypothetical protein
MTDRDSTIAALDSLRDANPVPGSGSAPPFADVLARAQASPSRSRVRSLLVPVVGVAVALAVVLVIGLSVSSDHKRPAPRRPAAPPAQTRTPRVPSGGMPGVIQPLGFGVALGGTGFISFYQCQPDRRCGCCGPSSRAGSTLTNWLATTTDAGRSWQVAPSSFRLFGQPVLSGRDGWAMGLRGTSTELIFVSHDGGLRWTVAHTPGSPFGLSVAAGEVWSLAYVSGRGYLVLHGAIGGSALAPTAQQPAIGDHSPQVVAVGASTAYVYTYAHNGSEGPLSFVTHDDGRTWQPAAAACPVGYAPDVVSAGGPDALRAGCVAFMHDKVRNVVRRSDDGGRHWRVLPQPFGGIGPLESVSASVAWAQDGDGDILRTIDGGTHWTKVWTVSGSQPRALAVRYLPQLALESQNADRAAILVMLSRGSPRHPRFTNFVIYQTTNAGRSWTPTVVALPR